MRRATVILGLVLVAAISAINVESHDAVTTSITWNREVSRIVHERCVVCHREGSVAFSLESYELARPWAVAIKEETLSRRMPPWGAVRGFQDLRNDQSLTSEELEMLSSWVEGGVPEGEPKDLPPAWAAPLEWTPITRQGSVIATGPTTLRQKMQLDGVALSDVPEGTTFQLIAETPTGVVIPLLWIYEYQSRFSHAYLFKTPIELPANTKLHGLPTGVRALLLPVR